ncbi:Rpn family recombination-promoting nuclease/putative transposase [uncultured Clostridium sp.]|uniref:Rpn family recombination-promoting nuclease/putative transposase n=1 Tax=uncultured Clostridium sp. TaxID=59620 RepID=UPI0026096851|nr:Rpn family recombination-promoting nuclease/putative transposase [uncultured Clostridium sp.]
MEIGLLKPEVDFVFKKIFGNEKRPEILISFLNAVMESEDKIISVEIQGTDINQEHIDDKYSRLDIKARTNKNEKVNIEIQVKNEYNMIKRSLYYWSKMYEEDLKKGENYDKLKRTVCINLLSFNYLKNDRYHNGYRLKEVETNEELTDIQEIHFIELPKLKESDEVEVSNLLEAWVSFIKNPESKRVKALERNIDEIKKAKEELINLSSDREQRDIYLQRMMAISDRVSDLENATQKGIEEGERRAKEKAAKALMKLNTPLETIIIATGLSEEEIEYLAKNKE